MGKAFLVDFGPNYGQVDRSGRGRRVEFSAGRQAVNGSQSRQNNADC